jgi:metallo-beta-lactamase family protein
MAEISLTFCGGVGSVTGANFLLETKDKKILIDCGLEQGFRENTEDDPNYANFPYDPSSIDFLFVTHAHADHIGRIPKLVKDGFKGIIYSTPATQELVYYMLEDACSVIATEAKRDNRMPMYEIEDVKNAISLWKNIPYHEEFKLTDDLKVWFKDAGHILGSAMIYFHHNPSGKNIVFTGDLGNSPTPLIQDTEPIPEADFLIMESVYGDRVHEGKEIRKEKLCEAVQKIIDRKGTLLIPVFSLEKTQVLLHELNDLIEGNKISSVPVFFDSPLGIKLTEIYAKQFQAFNLKVQERIKRGDDIFDFPKLIKTFDHRESEIIHRTIPPKIIIASSGMSVGGRIMEHERRYLPDPKNAILFIGHQVVGTLGRKIKDGSKTITIQEDKVPIKAEIITIDGYSSHKDSEGLVDFVATAKDRIKKVFVVMGEPKSALFLVQRLRDYLDIDAVHPALGEKVELL